MQVKSTLCGKSLEEIGDAFVKALYCVDVQEDAFINTAEFFMEKQRLRFTIQRALMFLMKKAV